MKFFARSGIYMFIEICECSNAGQVVTSESCHGVYIWLANRDSLNAY